MLDAHHLAPAVGAGEHDESSLGSDAEGSDDDSVDSEALSDLSEGDIREDRGVHGNAAAERTEQVEDFQTLSDLSSVAQSGAFAEERTAAPVAVLSPIAEVKKVIGKQKQPEVKGTVRKTTVVAAKRPSGAVLPKKKA
jgi:hypothetical protein